MNRIRYRLGEQDDPTNGYQSYLRSGTTVTHGDRRAYIRFGPTVPDIVLLPWDVIVITEAAMLALSKSGLTGIAFEPLPVAKIVHVDWENWDRFLYPREFNSMLFPDVDFTDPSVGVLGEKGCDYYSYPEVLEDSVYLRKLYPMFWTIHFESAWHVDRAYRNACRGQSILVDDAVRNFLTVEFPDTLVFEEV